MKRKYLGYLAGFLDGEACLRWHSGPEVVVSSCYPRTLHLLQSVYGGIVHRPTRRRKNHKSVWRWVLRNEEAIDVVKMVRPLLCEKATQADVLLLMWGAWGEEVQHLDQALRGLKRIDYAE